MSIGLRAELHSGTASHERLLASLRATGATPAAAGVYVVAGTGAQRRRLAALQLAGAFGRTVIRVDLQQVVSKYIGETEKHLAQLFDRADATDATLFFDEADSLFGSRTTVHESNYGWRGVDAGRLRVVVSIASVRHLPVSWQRMVRAHVIA